MLVGAGQAFATGQRRCPNPDCNAHLFVVLDGGKVVISYPPETIDFDTTNLPAGVLAALKEAVTCHATRCYVAAGIMVRKCLEELCDDRGATGANLKDRIKGLGSTVVLPKELLEGMDDLRLLGNDAAHIESQVFKQVGSDEIELAIEVTKEVLKAVYQLSALVEKLQKLKH